MKTISPILLFLVSLRSTSEISASAESDKKQKTKLFIPLFLNRWFSTLALLAACGRGLHLELR
jgi:hypothetical protein